MCEALTVSLTNIYVDQVVTGVELDYLSQEELELGRARFLEDKRSSKDSFEKIRVPIWNTLHYQYLLNPSKYAATYERFVGETLQFEHSLKNFEDLSSNFNPNKLYEFPIEVEVLRNHIQVLDGVHRLATYFYVTGNKTIDRKSLRGVQEAKTQINGMVERKYLKFLLSSARGTSFSNSWAVTRDFPAGYHSFDVFGLRIRGQRNNRARIDKLSSELTLNGRSVVDLGCNTGGMLFHWPSPSFALGIDFDKRAIKFAKRLKNALRRKDREMSWRFSFRAENLDDFDVERLRRDFQEKKVDTVLLLSIGSWVKNWRDLYSFIASFKVDIILETNNDEEGKSQIEHLSNLHMKVRLLAEFSDDDISGNSGRKMYLVQAL